MPSIEPDDGVPATQAGELPHLRSRSELLDHIYAEGGRRRRRRRMGGLGLSAAALAVVVGAVLATSLPGGTPQHVATRGQTAPPSPGSSTSSLILPTTTLVTAAEAPTTTVAFPTPAVPTTVRPTASATSQPSTTVRPPTTDPDPGAKPTTTLPPSTLASSSRCINSADPACGPFHWQPDPGSNAPLVIEVTPTAKAAEPLTYDFAIIYSDSDAPIVDGCRSVGFGDGESTFTGSTGSCVVAACIAAFGAWTPPLAQPGRVEATVSHTFPRAGTYEVTFNAISRHSLCHDPYASSATRTVTVVVP
ncbi:MAG: hypothetical protein ACRD2W_07775 [Acidimicrobiales bacterium]